MAFYLLLALAAAEGPHPETSVDVATVGLTNAQTSPESARTAEVVNRGEESTVGPMQPTVENCFRKGPSLSIYLSTSSDLVRRKKIEDVLEEDVYIFV